MTKKADIQIKHEIFGGFHVYTSPDVPELRIANLDPVIAEAAIQPALDRIEATGLSKRPDFEVEEFGVYKLTQPHGPWPAGTCVVICDLPSHTLEIFLLNGDTAAITSLGDFSILAPWTEADRANAPPDEVLLAAAEAEEASWQKP